MIIENYNRIHFVGWAGLDPNLPSGDICGLFPTRKACPE